MANELVIENIKLSPPYTRRFPLQTHSVDQHIVDVEVHVKNNSKDSTYYVISDIRKRVFIHDTKTLYISFSEESPIKEKRLGLQISAPGILSIPPGKLSVLTGSIPLILKRIIGVGSDMKLNVQESDLSELRHIICSIGYSNTQLNLNLQESSDKMIGRMLSWSSIVQKQFDITIPRN